MAIAPDAGGAFVDSFFGTSGTNNFVTYNGNVVSGIGLNAVGRPSVVSAQGRLFMVNQTNDGLGSVRKINPPGGSKGKRMTWQEVR